MISNLVYQLGFASFNFPFAASLCVAGLTLTIVVLSMLRAGGAPARKYQAALRCPARPISACSSLIGKVSGFSDPRLPGAAGRGRHDRGV